jgi:hypothetical protein
MVQAGIELGTINRGAGTIALNSLRERFYNLLFTEIAESENKSERPNPEATLPACQF